jgi:hypothetical protein
VYYPEELHMLSHVCRRLRWERGIKASDESAKDIADLALILYSAGISEETDLIQKLRQRA